MPKGPTIKQKKFVEKYLETGNAAEAARSAYNVKSLSSATSVGHENLTKPDVLALIQDQAVESLADNVAIRNELRASKKDYGVRFNVNRDLLDRAGYKPVEKVVSTVIKAEYLWD